MNKTLSEPFDLFIIGGGINGVGIAHDAQGRGLNVGLCEQNDIACGTSSASSKLIHGGLRYLEFYEFKLVRKALIEREVIKSIAPHIVKPLRFQIPHSSLSRPAWMVRAGLFLYDQLAKNSTLPKSKSIQFSSNHHLKTEFKKGFEYSDLSVDDSRLVVLNTLQFTRKGGKLFMPVKLIEAKRTDQHWQLTLLDQQTQIKQIVYAKALVNATGPWVENCARNSLPDPLPEPIKLVQGSHIIVPKLYHEPHAYLLQNTDGRVVFVIPYQEAFSLIGTTDTPYQGDLSQVACKNDEIDYLCDTINTYFNTQLHSSQVLHHFSGVRPLVDNHESDPKKLTRDYKFHIQTEHNLPLLTVLGGKLTTYRVLAEEAVNLLKPYFKTMGSAWTAQAPLPGYYKVVSTENYADYLKSQYPWITSNQATRYANSYGSLSLEFLNPTIATQSLGIDFGHGLSQAEVDYLITKEWTYNTTSLLQRRTKLGLWFTKSEIEILDQYINHYLKTH